MNATIPMTITRATIIAIITIIINKLELLSGAGSPSRVLSVMPSVVPSLVSSGEPSVVPSLVPSVVPSGVAVVVVVSGLVSVQLARSFCSH